MPESRTIIMAGGGTGGHVIPAIAVARELASRGHRPIFVGTPTGFEARLVPASGFPLELIEIGGLKRVGPLQTIRTLAQLPIGFGKALNLFSRYRPSAIFSMGGFVAGPVVLAGIRRSLPIVVMEPNAMPGMTNRRIGRWVSRALLSFPEAERFFPRGKTEITGLPVRHEFFELPPKPSPANPLTILITGGSRGSRTLNEAARASWPLFRNAPFPVYLIHQTGTNAHESIASAFAATGLQGSIVPFIEDMPAAFAEAHLVICRSGAGAVAELAAAGKPAILVPFPFAADQHQLKNAEALARASAATLILDRDMTGPRLFSEVARLHAAPDLLIAMGQNARTFAHPRAAQRAAEILEQLSHGN